VFLLKESGLRQGLLKKGIKSAGLWYRVEAFTNAGPDSRCELCCGWGHLENKCGNKHKCGYCSGNHRTNDHKCNVVGSTVKQGALCGHTLEKCANCEGNHIVFSSWCAKMCEAARVARQSRKTGTAARAPTSEAIHTDTATRTNRVLLARIPWGGAEADGGCEEKERAEVEDEEAAAEARDVVMTETETATTAATETETEAGALSAND